MFNNKQQSINLAGSNNQNVNVAIRQNGKSIETKLPSLLYVDTDRNGRIKVTTKDPCYQFSEFTIPKSITPVYWLNILNIHGFYIDYFLGNIWEYPNQVFVPTSSLDDKNLTCSSNVNSETILANEKSNVIFAQQPSKIAYEYGFIPQQFGKNRNRQGGGRYVGINYQLDSAVFLSLKLLRISAGCSNQLSEFQNYDSCPDKTELYTKQENIILTINHEEKNAYGLYFGAGFGITNVYQSYIGFDNQFLESRARLMPLVVQFGFHTPNNLKINIFGSASLGALKLGSDQVINGTDNTFKINNPNDRLVATQIFNEGLNYSSIGVGFEWKVKSAIAHIGSVGLAAIFYQN